MYLGEVIGTVVATQKDARLRGTTLLLIQPLDENRQPRGDREVAIDTVQAGVGDFVFLVGSREASLALGTSAPASLPPVDAAVVGIVDDLTRMRAE